MSATSSKIPGYDDLQHLADEKSSNIPSPATRDERLKSNEAKPQRKNLTTAKCMYDAMSIFLGKWGDIDRRKRIANAGKTLIAGREETIARSVVVKANRVLDNKLRAVSSSLAEDIDTMRKMRVVIYAMVETHFKSHHQTTDDDAKTAKIMWQEEIAHMQAHIDNPDDDCEEDRKEPSENERA